MKKASLIVSLIFTILTFVGMGYVLYSGGKANAGYAVVPMSIAVACLMFSKQAKE